jgi:tetratricopeptide (TPR) repeat protein
MSFDISFAQKLLNEEKYEEAAVAAEKAMALDPEDPEPHFDRATALANLDRYAEAASHFEKALALDEAACVLTTDFVDDAYFSALLGAARQASAPERLERYLEVLPEGRHVKDVGDWQKRLRGELPSEFVKERIVSD